MLNKISEIVKLVGENLIIWYENEMFEGTWEGNQFKAKVDKLAHDLICKHLNEINPRIPIISEEDKDSLVLKRPNEYWLIDPIDGTASFIQGYRGFVTQIALIKENRPQYAAIYAPRLNELYTAQKGLGAFFNGKKIKRLSINANFNTLIDNYPIPQGIADEVFKQFNFKKYIECGSISLKICKVAINEADLFIKDVKVRDWDIGAPKLVLDEVGGYLTKLDGTSFDFKGNYEHNGLIASNSHMNYQKIMKWLKKR